MAYWDELPIHNSSIIKNYNLSTSIFMSKSLYLMIHSLSKSIASSVQYLLSNFLSDFQVLYYSNLQFKLFHRSLVMGKLFLTLVVLFTISSSWYCNLYKFHASRPSFCISLIFASKYLYRMTQSRLNSISCHHQSRFIE